MGAVKYTEDCQETREFKHETLQDSIDNYAKAIDWGTAAWSRRIELLDNEGKTLAVKWLRSPVRKEWTLERTVARIRELWGDEAVDRYLDLQEPNVPWENCIDCERITPRNPETLQCVYKESHE